MDVTAGLNRALRLARPGASERERHASREPIRAALLAIEAVLYKIDQIRDIIEEAYDVALSARETEDAAARALLADSYDEMRLSLEAVADENDEDSGPLIGKRRRTIEVRLGGQAKYSVSPVRLDASAQGLALSPPRGGFADDDEVMDTLEELDRALQKADRVAASYCRDAQFLMARLELQAALPHAKIA